MNGTYERCRSRLVFLLYAQLSECQVKTGKAFRLV